MDSILFFLLHFNLKQEENKKNGEEESRKNSNEKETVEKLHPKVKSSDGPPIK